MTSQLSAPDRNIQSSVPSSGETTSQDTGQAEADEPSGVNLHLAPQPQPNLGPKARPTSRVSENQPDEWVSRRLRWPWLTMCFLVNIAIVIVIITLIQISARKNGIATVPRPSTNVNVLSISSLWQYGLLWTSLPSLLLTLFALMWSSTVAAAADRQPFIELRRSHSRAANAKVTIMLDYRAYSVFTAWFHAFRNRHFILGFAMITSLILNLAAVPLASHMLAPVDSQHQHSVPISYLTSFEDSLDILRYNLQSAIDLTTAILVYGGVVPAWMTPQKAFIGFSETQNPSIGNLTAFTNAYSGYLDCQILNSSSYRSFPNSTDTLLIEDRGCTFQQLLTQPSANPFYISVWYSKCSGQYNRIGLFSGVRSATSPFNLSSFSVISCIPSYWQETGELTVSTAPRSLPALQGFTSNSPVEISPQSTTVLEVDLPNYSFLDASGEFYSNAAGFAVYQIATSRDAASPFNSTLLKDCLEQFYNTFYAALLIEKFVQAAAGAGNGSATLSVQVTRLYMIDAISYGICSFLIVLSICTVLLFIYTLRHRSILCEEPVGLFGIQAITLDSGLSSFLSTFRRQHPTESKPSDFVKSNYTVRESKCYYLPHQFGADDLRHRTVPVGQIQVTDLEPKP